MANTAKEKKKDTIKKQTTDSLPLMRNNFIIMIAAAVLSVVGFVLMGVGIIVRPRETKKD